MPRPRLPLWPVLASAAVLVAWLAAVPPLRDLVTLGPAAGASLVHSPAFLLLAPLCDVMDAMSLLSVAQILSLLLGVILLHLVWRVAAAWRARGVRPLHELRLLVRLVGAIVAFCGLAAIAPRPMARLSLHDPADVAIDFHSHTSASHDGRAGFTARRNEGWHRAAGFDVSFITDHASLDAAMAASSDNPARAGDGLVSLAGIEFIYHDEHVNALAPYDEPDRWFGIDPSRHWDPALAARLSGWNTVLIQTIPEDLSRVPLPDSTGRGGVAAIELSDGAPRGIRQTQRDRELILRIADSLDLVLVAGSDNHGWGRTAVAWSVMRVPGWRAMAPMALGAEIERRVRDGDAATARVIARRSPDPRRSDVALALTLPAVAWRMLTTLSPAERASWLAWIWILWAAAALSGARAGRRAVHADPSPAPEDGPAREEER